MGAPIVTPTITKYLLLNSVISASELFTVRDPDDDPITRYSFWDQSANAATGFFRVRGAPQPNGQKTFVAASDLSQTEYVAGSQIGSETIRIAARDLFNFGAEATIQIFFVKANVTAPMLSTRSFSILESESIFLNTIVTASDPDGWPIQTYYFRDSNSGLSGIFEDDSTQYSQTTGHYYSQAQFPRVRYTGRLGGEQETVESYVYDGTQWSLRSTFVVSTIANTNRPTAIFNQINTPIARAQFIEDLFTFFDPDGNTAKFWEVYDTNPHATSGSLRLNGAILPSQTWVRIADSDMGGLAYTGAQTTISETIRFRVYDGKYWSEIQNAVLHNLERPKVSYDPLTLVTDLDVVPASSLFTKVDAGPAYEWIEVIDRSPAFNSSKWAVGTNILGTLPANQVHRFTAAEFQNVYLRTGRIGPVEIDDMAFRVNNGTFTSPWEKFKVFTIPNFPNFMRTGEQADAVYPSNNPHNDWADHYRDPISRRLEVVTFSFKGGFTEHPTADEATADNSFGFTAAQRLGTRQAFLSLGEFLNVRFEEVSDYLTFPEIGQGGMIRLANYNNPPPDVATGDYLGYVYHPLNLANDWGGDIWVNTAFISPTAGWSPGSNSPGYSTLWSGIITAMGVNNGGPGATAAAGGIPFPDAYGLSSDLPSPITPLLNDVFNLHNLYGANMNTRTGDTTYSIANSWGNDPAANAVIWDAGGNDTISAEHPSITRGAVIDLREYHFSSIGTGNQNIAIAVNAKIENAIGTRFGDTINGNDMSNRIETGTGNDIIWSNSGDDFLFGGANNDTYRFDVGDGVDVIDELRLGGVDSVSFFDFPGIDSLANDFTFRREARDLIIDLTIDGSDTDATIRIENQRWGGSAVETLSFTPNGGTAVRINLNSVYAQTTGSPQRFASTGVNSSFGLLVSPVT
jgi:Peptidase M10 serralysin C terminal